MSPVLNHDYGLTKTFIYPVRMLNMGKVHRINENEKELLNAIGNHPDISMKELLTHTNYKWTKTITRKLNQLKKQGIYLGPYYDLNYSKLSTNPIHKLFCIVEFDQSYETVVSYLRLVESLRWVYPVLSPHKKLLNVGFLSSDDTEIKAIFQILKDNNIITDYIVRPFCSKRIGENPNFFGDPNPSLDNLLAPCDVPDMALECHDTVWNTCDIAVLPYLRKGYRGGNLVEILRKEKGQQRNWSYEQIKYSREKMIKNGLIEKKYVINPFPLDQCVDFNLFLKPEDTTLTQRILYNFARGARVYREYVICEDWGMMGCTCHRRFLTGLLYKLDNIGEIREKEMYQIRSIPAGKYFFFPRLELKYFDLDNQTLEYPYRVYKEKVKENLEEWNPPSRSLSG